MCEASLLGQRRRDATSVSFIFCGAFGFKSKDLTMRAIFLMAILESLQQFSNSAKICLSGCSNPQEMPHA